MYGGRKRASQLSDPPGILWQMMSRIKLQNTHFLPLLELGTSSVAKLLVLLHICHVFLRLSWSHRKRDHVLLLTCYFHPSQSLFLTEVWGFQIWKLLLSLAPPVLSPARTCETAQRHPHSSLSLSCISWVREGVCPAVFASETDSKQDPWLKAFHACFWVAGKAVPGAMKLWWGDEVWDASGFPIPAYLTWKLCALAEYFWTL